MPYFVLVLIFSFLLLPGFIGTVLTLPGLPYMFLVALIFGFIDKFSHLRPQELIYLGIIAVLSIIVDYTSGILGAKFSGANKRSIIGGLVGLLLGLLFYPPLGVFAGLFLGILVMELTNKEHWKKALKAASGSLAGVLVGILINMLLAGFFIILFVLLVAN